MRYIYLPDESGKVKAHAVGKVFAGTPSILPMQEAILKGYADAEVAGKYRGTRREAQAIKRLHGACAARDSLLGQSKREFEG